MKKKAYLIILPLAAALALSCTREIIDPATETATVAAETGDQEVKVPFTVEAGAPETRVAVSGSTSTPRWKSATSPTCSAKPRRSASSDGTWRVHRASPPNSCEFSQSWILALRRSMPG